MAKKKEGIEKKEVDTEKKYLVRDPENADRVYTEATHGFNFTLESTKVEEVDESTMKLLKKASPFLEFEIKK